MIIPQSMKGNMDNNHSEQITQYAKLETLYKTIIYLQKEIVKEQDKLKQLKLEEQHNTKKEEKQNG